MKKRILIKEVEPAAYEAMMALENYSKGIQVDTLLKELIKIRASQINNCAYCIDMHTEAAIKSGEKARRLFALSAWEESNLFRDEERIVLKLTDEITNISKHGLSDETYQRVLNLYGEKVTAQLIMQIVLINAWNRIAVSTKMIYKAGS